MKITSRIVAHAQGTEAWHEHRRSHLNASELAVVMGLSPYRTRADLIRSRATGVEPEIDDMTARRFQQGHDFEAIAREWAEELLDDALYPTVLAADVDGLQLSASLDGQVLDGSVIWEHKSGRADLLVSLGAGVVPEQYHPQLEQGLLLSGASRCLFMASSGDRDSMRFAWYESRPELRAQIVPTWRQYMADLAAYTLPAASEPAPVGKSPDTLPALLIQVTGAVTASNLAEFKSTALGAIRSVNRDLRTDADFADADKAMRWCADVESRIKAAKEHAQAQASDIDALFKTLDDITAEARTVRLDLSKLAGCRKQEVKEHAVAAARNALDLHIAALQAELAPMRFRPVAADFAGCIKGLRSIASMQDALDTTLAGAKIAADSQARLVRGNVTHFKLVAAGSEFLFPDLGLMICKAPDDFVAVLADRMAKHEADEARRAAKRQADEAQSIAAAEKRAREQDAERLAYQRAESDQLEALAVANREHAAAGTLHAPAQPAIAMIVPPPAALPWTATIASPAAHEPATLKLGTICEALRRDADRYRYLRSRAYKDGATLVIDVAMIDDIAIGDFGEFIDATADAAIMKDQIACRFKLER